MVRRRPLAPLMTISLLGVTCSFRASACHAGIRLTDAPVSKSTVVALRFSDVDLVGTFGAIKRLYAGTEVLPSSADLAYSVELILYSVKCTCPWHFPVGPSLTRRRPCLEDLSTAWIGALGSLFLGWAWVLKCIGDVVIIIRCN